MDARKNTMMIGSDKLFEQYAIGDEKIDKEKFDEIYARMHAHAKAEAEEIIALESRNKSLSTKYGVLKSLGLVGLVFLLMSIVATGAMTFSLLEATKETRTKNHALVDKNGDVVATSKAMKTSIPMPNTTSAELAALKQMKMKVPMGKGEFDAEVSLEVTGHYKFSCSDETKCKARDDILVVTTAQCDFVYSWGETEGEVEMAITNAANNSWCKAVAENMKIGGEDNLLQEVPAHRRKLCPQCMFVAGVLAWAIRRAVTRMIAQGITMTAMRCLTHPACKAAVGMALDYVCQGCGSIVDVM